MASVNRIDLLAATALTAASTNSTAVTLEALQTDFVAYLNVSVINAATTATVKLQHSPDGTIWFDVDTFAAVAASAAGKALNITAHLFPKVRVNVALTGVTLAATVAVSLHYDKKR